MNRFACMILLVVAVAAALAVSTANADTADDLASLRRALERLESLQDGTTSVEDPRQNRPSAQRGLYNVMEFGAKGDGITDDTEPIQRALNAAYWDGGGVVKMPTGRFLVKTHLVIPSNVTLEGVWRKPSWGPYAIGDGSADASADPTAGGPTPAPEMMGTILLAIEGQGDPDGTPFISLNGPATDASDGNEPYMTDAPRGDVQSYVNATISGVTIYYPEQVRANPPHAYPWTIQGRGDDIGILNVSMINAYQAVDVGTYPCGRHFINGLYAYPFKTGIYINATFDVGRLNNVHLWPFFDLDHNSPLWEYTKEHGTSLKIGRTDGEQITNFFSIFYNKAVHLIGGPIRVNAPDQPERIEYQGGSGAFTNSYFDVAENAVVVDDSMENAGYAFVNCFIMSKVIVGPRNRGPIKFTGCGFWARQGLDTHAIIEGVSPVYFVGNHFSNWDGQNSGAPAIDANGRRMIISGNDFFDVRGNKRKINIGPQAREAVITSNIMYGGVNIENNAPDYADVQIGYNAGLEIDGRIRRWNVLGPFPNPAIEGAREGEPTRAGFHTDYLEALGGEANAVLRPNTQVQYTGEGGETINLTANNVPTNDAGRLDFVRRLQAYGKVGYAFAEFEAEGGEEYHVEFASSDSAKVWVNGELVHSIWTQERLFRPGQDLFTFTAQKGENRILVKVEASPDNHWEFMFEARDADGEVPRLLPRYRTPSQRY